MGLSRRRVWEADGFGEGGWGVWRAGSRAPKRHTGRPSGTSSARGADSRALRCAGRADGVYAVRFEAAGGVGTCAVVDLAGAVFGVLKVFFMGDRPLLAARMRSLKCARARCGGSRFLRSLEGGGASPDSASMLNTFSSRASSLFMRLSGVASFALPATTLGSIDFKMSLESMIAFPGSLTALASSRATAR
jgi:hypothetical protein